MPEELKMLEAASRKYEKAKAKVDEAKNEVVEAIVVALRAGESPTDVAERAPFTPAYVRRIAREHGIKPAPPGPKAKRSA